jgi:hypothetical protein
MARPSALFPRKVFSLLVTAVLLATLLFGPNAVQEVEAVPNTWNPTGSLNTARDQFTATLLPNGQVLAVGG